MELPPVQLWAEPAHVKCQLRKCPSDLPTGHSDGDTFSIEVLSYQLVSSGQNRKNKHIKKLTRTGVKAVLLDPVRIKTRSLNTTKVRHFQDTHEPVSYTSRLQWWVRLCICACVCVCIRVFTLIILMIFSLVYNEVHYSPGQYRKKYMYWKVLVRPDFLNLYLYVYGCLGCMCVCVPCACLVPGGQSVGYPGTGVTVSLWCHKGAGN